MGRLPNSNHVDQPVTHLPEDNQKAQLDATFAGSDLSCERGGRVVFSGLDFCLASGQALVLTGPNGAGKTSAIRLLAGLLRPVSGSIRWGDEPIADDPGDHAKRLCLVGHNDALKPAWTLTQNLNFWARFAGAKDPGQRAEAALQALDLAPLGAVPVNQLSRGQTRRGALARLLLVERPLWLLDEPTASLDSASSQLVSGLIEDHRARGGRAIIATHLPMGLKNAQMLEFAPARLEASI